MNYHKGADYLGFLEDLQQRGLVEIADEAVKSKESYDRFIKNLAVFCKKRRRSHLLKRYERLKRNKYYEEAIESVADESGWSSGTVRHVLGRNR